MAQRRMFSPQIVESEEFLDMPHSSQLLYFHLCMRADDDGFAQPKLIMRLIGSNSDDLKVLIGKRFLLPFESGVIVIKHWLIHNMIRKDRYIPTRFQKEKEALYIKENNAYTDNESNGKPLLATKWQPNGNQMAPQVRLGKVRLGKDKEDMIGDESPPPAFSKEFINFWEAYPSKVGKKAAWRAWQRAKDRPALDELLKVVERQKQSKQWQEGYIPHPATWLNQGRWDDEVQDNKVEVHRF